MDSKVISMIRGLSVDMINEAKSGHPGICLGAAPIIYTLFSRHLNFNTEDTHWINRDRFVLSAGHGSAMLYSTLYLAGYPIEYEELKTFRQIGSRLTGHPERNVDIGIEVTTGPLGEGFAIAVGLAIGEEYLSNSFSREIFDNYTYVLCGDGDLMEGISYESASLAGSLKLGSLIVLYDSNNISLDGKVTGVFNDNVLQRFDSCGWHTSIVTNGEDVNAISEAIEEAKRVKDKPSIIEIKTIIGNGSELAGTNLVHGKPLSSEDIKNLKANLGLHDVPFKISKEATLEFRNYIKQRVLPIYNEWQTKYKRLIETNQTFRNNIYYLINNNFQINLSAINIQDNSSEEELRVSNGKIMNLISNSTPLFLGGSADVASSTKTELINGQNFKLNGEYGKNIHFGVRENAMCSVINGLALLNLKAFGSTFLAFSDYMKPGIRLASLMKIPSIYVFTHDSITIGEDGPTHQPIEQIGALRSIPNLFVYRPADILETLSSWEYILNTKNPTALIISKDKLPKISNDFASVQKGAYIIKKEKIKLGGIIMASGSDVHTAIKIAEELQYKDIDVRVVSVPCLELFELQSEEYKKEILPRGVKIITLESSNDTNWLKYATNDKYCLKINTFGISAKKKDVLNFVGFDYDTLLNKVQELL